MRSQRAANGAKPLRYMSKSDNSNHKEEKRGFRRGGKVALVIILSLLLFIFLLEVSCRLFIEKSVASVQPRVSKNSMWQFDKQGYGFLRPGKYNDMKINGLGLRGNEIARKKKPGFKRILMIGGSTTFCWGVKDEETYPKMVEKMFLKGNNAFEFVNGGCLGIHSYHHLMRLQKLYLALKPDVVTIFIGWNDFITYFLAVDDWKPNNPYIISAFKDIRILKSWLYSKSSLYRVIYSLFMNWRFSRSIRKFYKQNKYKVKLEMVKASLRRNLEKMIDAFSTHNIKTVIIQFPWLLNENQIQKELAEITAYKNIDVERTKLMAHVPRNAYPVFDEIKKSKKISVAYCDRIFKAMPLKKRSELFIDEIHLSAAGNRLLAQCIYKALIPVLKGQGAVPEFPESYMDVR